MKKKCLFFMISAILFGSNALAQQPGIQGTWIKIFNQSPWKVRVDCSTTSGSWKEQRFIDPNGNDSMEDKRLTRGPESYKCMASGIGGLKNISTGWSTQLPGIDKQTTIRYGIIKTSEGGLSGKLYKQ